MLSIKGRFMQMERVGYDRLKGMLKSYSNEQPYLAGVLKKELEYWETIDSLRDGIPNWSKIPDETRLKLANYFEWSCRAYFPNIKNPVYAPDQIVEVRNPIGLSETYSKEKIQENFSAILGLASRIPEEFYQEDGCSYERITVDRDSGRWADGATYISAAFTGLCVAAGLLEYVNDPPSSYEEYRTRQNPTLVRATPGFRQYMKPYHEALKSANSEESLRHAQAIGEYILTTKVG